MPIRLYNRILTFIFAAQSAWLGYLLWTYYRLLGRELFVSAFTSPEWGAIVFGVLFAIMGVTFMLITLRQHPGPKIINKTVLASYVWLIVCYIIHLLLTFKVSDYNASVRYDPALELELPDFDFIYLYFIHTLYMVRDARVTRLVTTHSSTLWRFSWPKLLLALSGAGYLGMASYRLYLFGSSLAMPVVREFFSTPLIFTLALLAALAWVAPHVWISKNPVRRYDSFAGMILYIGMSWESLYMDMGFAYRDANGFRDLLNYFHQAWLLTLVCIVGVIVSGLLLRGPKIELSEAD